MLRKWPSKQVTTIQKPTNKTQAGTERKGRTQQNIKQKDRNRKSVYNGHHVQLWCTEAYCALENQGV
jgi:hypothetical protein